MGEDGVFRRAGGTHELKSLATRPAVPGFGFGDAYGRAIQEPEVGLDAIRKGDPSLSKVKEPQRSACQIVQVSDAMRYANVRYNLLMTDEVRRAAPWVLAASLLGTDGFTCVHDQVTALHPSDTQPVLASRPAARVLHH